LPGLVTIGFKQLSFIAFSGKADQLSRLPGCSWVGIRQKMKADR
jgi:hypothetical protein